MDGNLHRSVLRFARRLEMSHEDYAFGLEGIVVGETSVSCWQDGPQYRGYRLEELFRSSSFLEVTYLLLFGDLPDQELFADFESTIHEEAELDPAIGCVLEALPLHLCGIQTLRTMVSLVGNLDPHTQESDLHLLEGKAARIIAQVPSLAAMRYRFRQGEEPVAPHPGLSYAANLYYMFTGEEPAPEQEAALDRMLIVNAEHGFNTSTFAARVVASSGMDLHGSVLAALGTLNGDWQDSPSEAISELIDEIQQVDDVGRWINAHIKDGNLLPGFKVIEKRDFECRARLLRDCSGELATYAGETELEHRLLTVESALKESWKAEPHSGWYAQRIARYLGLDSEVAIDLFAIGRLAGWIAHCVEQARNNFRYDPTASYIGPSERRYVPLHDRL